MHSKDARANGETEQRLYGLSAWRETPYYSSRERAALDGPKRSRSLPTLTFRTMCSSACREQFSDDELAHLTLAIVSINGWNRLNVAARTVPGDYVAGSVAQLHAASSSATLGSPRPRRVRMDSAAAASTRHSRVRGIVHVYQNDTEAVC